MEFGYSLFTHCSFDNTKNKHDFDRGNNSVKKFCANLKKHPIEIINCEKMEILTLRKK